MSWRPSSRESLEMLHQLRHEIAERGDERLALLLAGVELFAVLGREFELLETMRSSVEEIHDAVAGTPTAKELEDLFNRETPE